MTNPAEASVHRAIEAATESRGSGNGFTDGALAAALLADGWTPPAPPPLTDEPDNLAARVVDRAGDVWARHPSGSWHRLSPQWCMAEWHAVVTGKGPLRLWEPSAG